MRLLATIRPETRDPERYQCRPLRHLARQEVRARHSLLHRLPVCRADPTEAVVMAHDQNQPIEAVLDAIGIIPIQSLLIDLLPTERILVRSRCAATTSPPARRPRRSLGRASRGADSAQTHTRTTPRRARSAHTRSSCGIRASLTCPAGFRSGVRHDLPALPRDRPLLPRSRHTPERRRGPSRVRPRHASRGGVHRVRLPCGATGFGSVWGCGRTLVRVHWDHN
jgi:hypothetical protein